MRNEEDEVVKKWMALVYDTFKEYDSVTVVDDTPSFKILPHDWKPSDIPDTLREFVEEEVP